MSASTSIVCPACKAGAGDPCATRAGKPKPTCSERIRTVVFADLRRQQAAAAQAQAPTPAPAADFDAATPPPKRRPRGEPIPAYVTLPAGEDVAAQFAQWDREGRVPAGSVLCEHRPHSALIGRGPSHVVVAVGGGVAQPVDVGPMRVAAAVVVARRAERWCVLSPKGAA